MEKLPKEEKKKRIEYFFENIAGQKSKEVKKMKKLAMALNIPLGKKRKLFCRKCLVPYEKPKTRIKNSTKTVTCQNCGVVSRWKIPKD